MALVALNINDVNHWRGLSTDTKPIAGAALLTTDSTFLETNTGTRFSWSGTAWVSFPLAAPSAAGGPTIDVAGKMGVDTTSRTLNFHDGTAEVVLNPVRQVSFFIETPVATDDWAFCRFRSAMTIIETDYLCVGGTNWVGQVQEGDANGLNGVNTQTADTTASAGTNAQVTSFSNAGIDAGDYLILKTTSISGTPTGILVTIYYRENA